MNNSHDIDMPYHPGCKHRYMEHLDHNALIKRLNEIADEIYNLTQLCGDLETRLSDHNADTEAHRYLRELINASTNRLATVKETIDNSLSILENKVDSNYSTLTAADGQLATRLDNIDTEIDNIRTIIENTTLDLQDSITSSVNGNKPIIKSVTTDNSVILAELPSEHGKFRYGTDETKTVVTYTANNNSTGIPNYTATLLDENGNTSFPGIVTAPTLRGNADTATLATKANKLNTAITIAIKDASGENLGSSVTTDLSGNITLKVPSVLKDTDITGTANKAHNDATGADIVDTYVHKTSINEEIDGTKTFNDVLKGSNIEPKVHTGSRLGNSTVPYENVYATNITSTNANINSITGTLTGNASTATKLATARKINGTDFDGTTAITTSSWGSARNISIGDASGTNTSAAVSVNGSSNITLKLPSTIKGTLTGNASTATKLAVSKKINNTSFDGSSNITTAIWGTARDVSITDNTGEHVGTKVSINGSANVSLKLPSNITADNFYGLASSAAKLNNAVTINGTSFDGTANITTAAWGYSRNIQIVDSDSTNNGAITAVNGTNNVTLKLPSTIKATLTGNAATATQFSANKSVTLTGDVTGTASSKAGWSVATTLANSGVTAGTYGPSADVTGNNNATISVPQITVDAKGRVTSVTNRTYTSVNSTYNVYNKTLTIQKNGTNVATFTSNSNTNVTANITVPTKVSELTNDSGFLTSHQSLANYVTTNTSQEITGKKFFKDKAVYSKRSLLDITQIPSTAIYYGSYRDIDGNGKLVKMSRGCVSSTGDNVWRVLMWRCGATTEVGDGDDTEEMEDSTLRYTVLRFTVSADGASRPFRTNCTSFAAVNNGEASLGTSDLKWSAVYANSYYLGTTAFGNIVTHNASEFLTSHQSLANYVTLNSAQTISAEKTISTNLVFSTTKTRGTAPSAKETRWFAEYKDSAGNRITGIANVLYTDLSNNTFIYAYNTTAATGGSVGEMGIGCDASGNVYTKAPTPATADNSTKIATTAFVKAQGYLTSHQSLSNYSTLANTVKSLSISGKTITVTPGSGSAYTLTTQDTVYTHPTTAGNKHIPSGGSSGQFLGWDSDGTAKWVNNPNTNTDTLVNQNVSTSNNTFPILIAATKNATANLGAKEAYFGSGVKINPSTSTIFATTFSGALTGNVTGNVTGNCSGSSGSCTGNAASATRSENDGGFYISGYYVTIE